MKCVKVAYRDRIAALIALSRHKDNPKKEKRATRAYHCPYCHKWHLTSQFLKQEA